MQPTESAVRPLRDERLAIGLATGMLLVWLLPLARMQVGMLVWRISPGPWDGRREAGWLILHGAVALVAGWMLWKIRRGHRPGGNIVAGMLVIGGIEWIASTGLLLLSMWTRWYMIR